MILRMEQLPLTTTPETRHGNKLCRPKRPLPKILSIRPWPDESIWKRGLGSCSILMFLNMLKSCTLHGFWNNVAILARYYCFQENQVIHLQTYLVPHVLGSWRKLEPKKKESSDVQSHLTSDIKNDIWNVTVSSCVGIILEKTWSKPVIIIIIIIIIIMCISLMHIAI
jgi:hypothetical protein